ncbi:MAG: glycosyltransferase family 39 protein [Ignavibacteriae bacterium]|nr:glycosyltransferase family 39 protein [Ignavibacteriota bacterium]
MQITTEQKIALLAFAAALVFSLVVFPIIADSQRAHIDPDRFGELGLSIADGNGYAYSADGPPVFERAPLYPFLLAALFKLVGHFSLTAVQILQAFFHSLTSYLVVVVASKFFRRRAALTAQLLYAFHPIALWYTARIWVESTNTLLLCVVVLTMTLLFERPNRMRAILTGIAIGVSCLVKPLLLLFPFVVGVLMIVRLEKRRWYVAILPLIIAGLVILPWTLRNYRAANDVLLVNTSLGFNLIQGDVIGEDWPSAYNTILDYWQRGFHRADSLLAPSGLQWESVEGDRTLISHATEQYLSNPTSLAKKVAANFFTFWYLSESLAKSIFFGILQFALLIAGVVSYIRLDGKERRRVIPISALVLYYIAVNVFIVGWARYSMPLIPLLLIVASPLLSRVISFGEKHE